MLRYATLGLLILPALPHAAAAEVSVIPLPAMWQVALDPDDAGTAHHWFAPDFDDSGWKPVSTHAGTGWEQQGLPEHVGFAWYRASTFVGMGLKKAHAWLYFSAVDEDATVWVNAEHAGEHTCASAGLAPNEIWKTPFFFDVAPLLHYEQPNHIAVRVHNRARMGGIYKPVYLFMSDEPLAPTQLHERATALNARVHAARGNAVRYDVWTTYAYEPVLAKTEPEGEVPVPQTDSWVRNFAERVALHAACGEYVPFVVNVRNHGPDTLPVRMDLWDVRHEALGLMLTADRIEPLQVDLFLTRALNIVPDPLPRLGGANALHVPPGETRSFFYLIDTRGMPAGAWRGAVQVTPMRAGPVLTFPFELNVAPVALPASMPIPVTMWEGNVNTRHAELDPRGGDDPYVALMQRTGVNVCMFHLYYAVPWPVLDDTGDLVGIDTVDFDRMMLRRKFRKDDYLLIYFLVAIRRQEWWGPQFMSDPWKRNMVRYLRLLAEHVRTTHGIPDDRWSLYLLDENIGEPFIQMGKLVREADPTIGIWANRLEDLEATKRAAPYIDIVVPHRGHMRPFAKSLAFLQEAGKEIWFYAHNGWFHDETQRAYHRHNASAPHTVYRRDGWLAWRWRVRGMGYWHFGSRFQRYSGMRGERDDRGRLQKSNTSFTYVGHDGPITSRRLEAYREGLEDYKLLWITDRAARMAGQVPELATRAVGHIRTAVGAVLTHKDDARLLLRWRRTLLDDAAALCAAAPLEVGIADIRTTQTSASVALNASAPVRVWTWLWHGTRYPSAASRAWQFIDTPAAGPTPTVAISDLVPGEPCKLILVVAGPEGQQRILKAAFETRARGELAAP